MAQKRVFYGVYQVGFSKVGLATYIAAHGVQSCGVNTRFTLDQIFEIGQISLYELAEQIPDVEVTMEKVLDGHSPLYCLATNGALSATLSGRSNIKSILGLSIFTDTQDSASGTPLSQLDVSGVFPSVVGWNFQVNGPFTESLTLVGNNKVWKQAAFTFNGVFNNDDGPRDGVHSSSGVNLRQDIIFGTGIDACLLPTEIPGIDANGQNVLDNAGDFPCHIQSIRVSCNLGRENMFELGRKGPYHRYVTFPVEVKTDIEVITGLGDLISATEAGVVGTTGDNLSAQEIVIYTNDGTILNMGTRNKLSSVTQGGANAGGRGGNMTVNYSYQNFNDLSVRHPRDPSGL